MTCTVPREPRRASLPNSSFVQAVAALNEAAAPPSDDAFAPRLGAWFDWTQAISLSGALGDAPARDAAAAGAWRPPDVATLERDRARTFAMLTTSIEQATAPAADDPRRHGSDGAASTRPTLASDDDFPAQRRRHAACQQAMDSQVGALRQRVRAALAGGPPHLAKLAELDGLMERVLAPRERALLAGVSAARLGARSAQLRGEAAAPRVDAPADAPMPWLATLRHEARVLLRAELELRLQPVDGLIAAARAAPPVRAGA